MWDYLNPFTYLGNAAGKIVADGWTAAMLGLWNAGLWLLKLVLGIVDAFTTPDLSEGGPGAQIYQSTFWIAGVLVVIMAMIQFGVAAVRRDGQSLARVLIGVGQFVMVWVAWLVYAGAVLAACGGLTRALMQALLHVDAWSAWQPWSGFSTQDITDGTVATVLGFMGIFLVFAAIGHLLVMLTRAGALMVLATTTPIAAAGLVSDVGRSWFWKSLRWFHAAAFTPVVMVLLLGIGVQLTQGVVTGQTNKMEAAIGTAVPGVVLICIGCFSPLALFKLLAFVDPGTSSGSALRAGLAAQGGVQGLLGGSGGGGGGGSTSGAASSTDQHGRSQGETAGEDSTSARFSQGVRGLMGQIGGAAGQAAAAGLGAMQTVGAKGAAIGADLSNQMGAGHSNYVPDFSSTKRNNDGQGNGQGNGQREDDNPEINGSGDGPDQVANPSTAATGTDGALKGAAEAMPPGGPAGGMGGPGAGGQGGPGGGAGGGAGGAGGAAGSAAGGAGAAASVPVVPV